VALVNAMCIVEAEYPAVVPVKQMWHEKGEVVANDLTLFIYPYLLTKDASPASAPEACLVVVLFDEALPCRHVRSVAQEMPLTHLLM